MPEGHKTRRAALALFTGAPALAILPAAALASSVTRPAVDPVYAAIAEHKRAVAAFNIVCTKDFDPDEMTDEENAEYDAANIGESDALEAVGRTLPTTREGAIEAAHYVGADSRGAPIALYLITLIKAMFPEGLANV